MFPLSILINFSAVDKEGFCHVPEWTLVPGGGPPHWECQHLEKSLGSAVPCPFRQWDQCFTWAASWSERCCEYPPLDLSNSTSGAPIKRLVTQHAYLEPEIWTTKVLASLKGHGCPNSGYRWVLSLLTLWVWRCILPATTYLEISERTANFKKTHICLAGFLISCPNKSVNKSVYNVKPYIVFLVSITHAKGCAIQTRRSSVTTAGQITWVKNSLPPRHFPKDVYEL